MLRLIIKKEILNSLRNSQFLISGIFLIALMLVSVLVGRQGQQLIQKEREKAQTEMHDKWVNQGLKHPHSAAHFGHFAFKPKPVLSFLDVGLDNYTGISVFLEAHKQNEILYSAAQDGSAMTRFGEMTTALVLQFLFPLLIIFLTFNIFSKEREEGTLKLIHAQGISMRQFLMGKIWGTYAMIMAIFIPVICLAFFVLDHSSFSVDSGVNSKFICLTISYTLFFLVFILIAVLVSAFSKSSSFSLLTSLGLWIIACIVLPKATANLADKIYPTPSQYEFRKMISEKVKNGIDGHNPRDERLNELKQNLLEEYGVSSIKELPVNWSGIAMQAGEEYTDKVYDQEFTKVEQIFKKQNRLSEWSSFINPYQAIRHLSMAFAGTDYDHHIVFAKEAENYRRAFVKKLNKDMELNHKPGVAFGDYNVGIEMWDTIEPFNYQLPSVRGILSNQWRSVGALLLWVMGLFLSASIFSKNISKI